MILAGTGHRPEKLGGYHPCPMHEWLKQRLRGDLERLKPKECISGMALGWDQWLAAACVDLGIPFTAAVPCDDQDARWPQAAKNQYRELLLAAKRIFIVNPGPYEVWKMSARNVWMVDHSTHLLACWDGSSGGTANCVRSAIQRGRSFKAGTIIRVNPEDFFGPAERGEEPW